MNREWTPAKAVIILFMVCFFLLLSLAMLKAAIGQVQERQDLAD